MIELTTGVAFLLSSMYGAGTPISNVANVQSFVSNSKEEKSTTTMSADRKVLEKYLKEKYADTPILVEIARCESNFTQFNKDGEVVRGIVNKADVGVMQINEKYHLETAIKLGYDIHTIEGNVAFGRYLYDKYGTDPWSASSKCWNDKSIAMK